MPIVAYNYAAKNQKRMDDTIRFGLLTGLIIGGISILMYEFAATFIMKAFIAEAQTVKMGTDFLLNDLMGMYGIVWSQITADVLTVSLSAWVYVRYRRKA